ncbi:endoribonuclease YbeY [Spirochaetia bacterium]|nr:endoribonuclease YbeY [Spirochaetia bacterium]
MNRVTVSAEDIPLPAWINKAEDFALKVLDKLGRDRWDLSLLFCGDRYIQSLNNRYRHVDEPTDVLSFTLGETVSDADGGGESRYLPGDIVISLETLEANALYFEAAKDEELRRLLVHGILHLDGLDHQSNEEAEPMLQLQEEILSSLQERIIP